jgi:hypothetical protein
MARNRVLQSSERMESNNIPDNEPFNASLQQSIGDLHKMIVTIRTQVGRSLGMQDFTAFRRFSAQVTIAFHRAVIAFNQIMAHG